MKKRLLKSGYDGGNPYVNVCLAILVLAKEDDALIWQEFKGTELYRDNSGRNVDSLAVALWVSDYLKGGLNDTFN